MRLSSAIAAIFGLLLLTYTGTALAKDYKQGEDYFSLGQKVSKVQKITEYFSFYCPACFGQETFMKSLRASLNNPEAFTKNHVTKMPGRNEEQETMLSQALITAKLLKVEDKVADAIFNRIHVNKGNFDNVESIKAIFVVNGVDEQAFSKTFSSFKVKMEAKRMAKNTASLRDKGYSAVPTLVINNNYIPNTRSVKSFEQYQALVEHLLTLNK